MIGKETRIKNTFFTTTLIVTSLAMSGLSAWAFDCEIEASLNNPHQRFHGSHGPSLDTDGSFSLTDEVGRGQRVAFTYDKEKNSISFSKRNVVPGSTYVFKIDLTPYHTGEAKYEQRFWLDYTVTFPEEATEDNKVSATITQIREKQQRLGKTEIETLYKKR